MRSKFAIKGHPIHPTLIPIPIGLFVWTLVADIVYLASRDPLWYAIAFWTGIAAVVSALVAALPGLGDYFALPFRGQVRRDATIHMLLNLTIVALYAVAAYLMRDGNALEGASLTIVVLLHALGTGLLLISGWLGGELVYRHRIAVLPEHRRSD